MSNNAPTVAPTAMPAFAPVDRPLEPPLLGSGFSGCILTLPIEDWGRLERVVLALVLVLDTDERALLKDNGFTPSCG
jgi:hypothetical protein